MAKAVLRHNRKANVIQLGHYRAQRAVRSQQLIRLAPELDGLSLLYSNQHSGGRLFAMQLLCWGLRRDGEVLGLLPWLNRLTPCTDLDDPVTGRFEGYYDPLSQTTFTDPPRHKVLELQSAARYFGSSIEVDAVPADETDTLAASRSVVQEIPDTIGTHAMLVESNADDLLLAEVLSWRLCSDGSTHAMLVDDNEVVSTPVLPGDDCLYAADQRPEFRYFFQHHIANQIKAHDPAAMEAIALLLDR